MNLSMQAYNRHSRRNRMHTELIFLFFGLITAQGAFLQKAYSAASILLVACKEVTLQASVMEMPHFFFHCFCILPFSS
jgi:hypothetical protein